MSTMRPLYGSSSVSSGVRYPQVQKVVASDTTLAEVKSVYPNCASPSKTSYLG